MKRLPLRGVHVLVGRARHQARALSTQLRKYGAEVIEIPFIEIRRPQSFAPLNAALRRLPDYDWLVLTSVNGTDAMWRRLNKLGLTKKELKHLKIAAIGPATKRAVEQHGVKVDVVPKEYVAESVVRSLRRRVPGKRVLLVRAKVARDVIPRELRKAGANVDVVDAYETVIPESSRSRLRACLNNSSRSPDVITFTSSSTVRNFVELMRGGRTISQMVPTSRGRRHPQNSAGESIRFASIGPITSATLRELGLPVHIEAKQYTIPGLADAIVRALKDSLSGK